MEQAAKVESARTSGSPELILISSAPDGTVTSARGSGLARFLKSSDEVVGRTLLEIFGPWPSLARGAQRALSGEGAQATVRIEEEPFEFFFEPQEAPAGRSSGALVVALSRQVRDRQPYLRLLFEQVPGAIWATDQELRLRHVRGRLLTEIGLERKRLEEKTVYDVVQSREPTEPAVAHHLAALAGEKRSFLYEFRGRTYDVLVEPLRDDTRSICGCLGAAIDVTERRRATRDLERSISLLRATLEATADGILVVDRAGQIVAFNQRFLSLWRIPSEVAENANDEELLSFVEDQLASPDSFRRVVHDLYDKPEREVCDLLEFRDGRRFERYSGPQRVGDEVVGRVWSFRDVTEREQILQAARFLSDATRLLASLDTERALESVAHLAIPYLGDACAIDLFGLEEPRRLAAHAPGVPRNPFPELHRTVLSGRSVVYSRASDAILSVPLLVHEGLVGAVTFRSRLERPYTGARVEIAEELAQRAALSIDNARLLRNARAALKKRDEFLSIAAHELRGPITSLRLAVQSLRKGAVPAEQREDLLRLIEREERRLTRFVDELLEVGRIRTGRLHYELEPVDLAEVARETASRLGQELRASGSALSIHSEGPVVGVWDRFRLEQVVGNLLSNAIKFGLGKPIEVTVSAGDRSARMTVEDHGIGILPELQARVFQAFERAVPSHQYGGLGIGLYIVQAVVEALGGSVSLESQPGAGSKFIVELPRTKDHDAE